MTRIARLYIQGLRNIEEVDLQPGAGINLLVGENGSGKTSVLEALYMLGTGRSFRGHLQRPVIQEGKTLCSVFAELDSGASLGIQRTRQGIQSMKVGGTQAESVAQLSHALPLMLINGDTFAILEGSPSERRRFIDWGVFHVKHEFLFHWKSARQALKQRNQLLRQDAAAVELAPWTHKLAQHAEQMDALRREYLQAFAHQMRPLAERLLGETLAQRFTMEYQAGWESGEPLQAQLTRNLPRDRQYGHTTLGPHRAELRLRCGGQDVAATLSRGQMKLLVCVLRLAQAALLRQLRDIECVLLIDDLPAELDSANRQRVCQEIVALELQAVMACIELESLQSCFPAQASAVNAPRMFHVKHGKIAVFD